MNQKRTIRCLQRVKYPLGILFAIVLGMISATPPAYAHAAVVDPYRLIATIQGPALPPQGDAWAFDQSWVDGLHHRYYLADTANRRIDVVDTRSNQLITTINGFTGVEGTSGDFRRMGPGGVIGDEQGHLFVGDGNSSLNIVTLATHQMISIGIRGQGRVDKLTYDPARHLVLAANSADVPPFVSIIDVRAHRLLDKLALPFATAGVGQPIYKHGQFLLAVPQTCEHPQGEIVVITVDRAGQPSLAQRHPIPIPCQPNGLVAGPRHQLLLGCAVGHPLIIETTSWGIRTVIEQVTGVTDEVWYNPTDHRFFTATAVDTAQPIVGVVDARTGQWLTSIPTVPFAHSVAVDPATRHVFVPMAKLGIGVFEPFIA